MTRLDTADHATLPWRIHEITADFRLEDVWAFRTPGAGPDDFPTMLAKLRAPGEDQPLLARSLFKARWKLGELFGWDRESHGLGSRVTSLRDRLPDDLRKAPRGLDNPSMPLKAVYELDNECARELANNTVHAVMHLSWAQRPDGEYELRMAVLVKPNGWWGRAYMAAIAPFRHLVVYPAMTRQWERAWLSR
ncbi:DUF2867 domain-containing protein [Actinokineospora diospyrosa]|uniref:DUF2867 domain-containing protein n=1 Tax=Actinokineospora diospyrosa TaxID=103728 RepID=A0ABT1IJ74_9PSEU|nr:DUF2867 domain-containing protein [Actinokineospora diospyrosa]MCP2272697.1 Protein of unknown function (DUF2867) [Actinokineospora diospyrosa]